jgi:hypothetical protein
MIFPVREVRDVILSYFDSQVLLGVGVEAFPLLNRLKINQADRKQLAPLRSTVTSEFSLCHAFQILDPSLISLTCSLFAMLEDLERKPSLSQRIEIEINSYGKYL